jgi:hypothetical protein
MALESMRLVKKKTRTSTPPDSANAEPAISEPQRSHHERIAELAYTRYVQRGRQDGYDLDDWLEAERQISSAVY